MINNLNTTALKMDDFKTSIINQLTGVKFSKMTYNAKTSTTPKDDLTAIIDSASLDTFKKNIHSKKDHTFVYIIKHGDQVKYVGKAVSIRKRLSDHLIKKSKKTNSKIDKIYDLLSLASTTEISYFSFRIEGKRIYSAVEGILIDHYDTVNNGWNDKDV